MTGMVFNIQRFSIDDGPGIRTTVFLKGCNLHCRWCHNPESISPNEQIQFHPVKCIKCKACCCVCPSGAISVNGGNVIYDKGLCLQCKKCIAVCPSNALILQGKEMTIDEVVCEILKDRPFYDTSGGGVTLSGGEPLLQKDFLTGLLRECKRLGLDTAVDTAGNVPWPVIYDVKQYVDLFLYDVKMMDKDKHRLWTGAVNDGILENLKRLAADKARIHIRVPVIPGVNDNFEEMKKMADFLRMLDGIELVELLPYHGLAESKYDSLGAVYSLKGCKPPDKDLMKELLDIFLETGLNALHKAGA